MTFCIERTTEIDKAAASRFIKHAITEAQLQQDAQAKAQQLSWKQTPAEDGEPDDSSSSESASSDNKQKERPKAEFQHKFPLKLTSKIIARQQYEQELREKQEEGSDEENVLDVYDETEHQQGQMDVDDTSIPTTKNKGKEKANAKQFVDASLTTSVHSVHIPTKRRKLLMDPFAASGLSHLIYLSFFCSLFILL